MLSDSLAIERSAVPRYNPGPLQIETPFAIPDTTQAPFRDGDVLPQDCVATDSDFAHSALALVEQGLPLPYSSGMSSNDTRGVCHAPYRSLCRREGCSGKVRQVRGRL